MTEEEKTWKINSMKTLLSQATTKHHHTGQHPPRALTCTIKAAKVSRLSPF